MISYYNKEKVFRGLHILTPILAKFIYNILTMKYKECWWQEGVIKKFDEKHIRELPIEGNDDFLLAKLDIDKLTLLIADKHWGTISKIKSSRFRTYIRELRDIRNFFSAHLGSGKIENRDLQRAIDTMARIYEIVGEGTSNEFESYIYNHKTEEDFENVEIKMPISEMDALIQLINGNSLGYQALKNFADMGSLTSKHLLGDTVVEDLEYDVEYSVDMILLLDKYGHLLDPKIQFKIGEIFHYGLGIDENIGKSIIWFKKAAEQAQLEAQLMLAEIYYYGLDVEKNRMESLYWYEKAAEQGGPRLFHFIADIYFYGDETPQNYIKAIKWYKKAGDCGVKESIAKVVIMYIEGLGIHSDYSTGIEWYNKAIQKGIIDTAYEIGLIYYNGDGVPQDCIKALNWFEQAKIFGTPNAIYFVTKCKNMISTKE